MLKKTKLMLYSTLVENEVEVGVEPGKKDSSLKTYTKLLGVSEVLTYLKH